MMAHSNPAWVWLLALACGGTTYADEVPGEQPLTANKQKAILSDRAAWDGLNILNTGKVESVRVVLQRRQLMSTAFGPVTLDVTERSPETIALFVAALADVRVVGLELTEVGATTVNEAGHITFRTSKGDVRIGLYTSEFSFDSPPDSGWSPETSFYSMSLATLLDAFLRKEGVAWPEIRIRRLSGKKYIDASVAFAKKKWHVDPARVRLAADEKARDGGEDLSHEWILWDPGEVTAGQLKMKDRDGEPVVVVTEDKETLLLLVRSIRLFSAIPRQPSEVADDAEPPLGELRLSTTNGVMLVDICSDGFRLRPVPKEFRGKGEALAFQSPDLAYVIDAMRRAAGAPPLSDELREALSGEAYLKTKRAAMLEMIAKVPAFREAVREPKPINPVTE